MFLRIGIHSSGKFGKRRHQPFVGAGLCACPFYVTFICNAGRRGRLPLQDFSWNLCSCGVAVTMLSCSPWDSSLHWIRWVSYDWHPFSWEVSQRPSSAMRRGRTLCLPFLRNVHMQRGQTWKPGPTQNFHSCVVIAAFFTISNWELLRCSIQKGKSGYGRC